MYVRSDQYDRCLLFLDIGVYLLQLKPFKAYSLRDAPTRLTFNNCNFCPHRIYVLYLYENAGPSGSAV